MSTSDLTPSDMFLTLNGFDEIAVAKLFGNEITELRESPFRFIRALVFVAERRNGAKDTEAFKTAMNMTVNEATDYFVEEADETEGDPEDPASTAGKDEPSS